MKHYHWVHQNLSKTMAENKNKKRTVDDIYIHASSLYKCMTGQVGITPEQQAKLDALYAKEKEYVKLTDKQAADLAALNKQAELTKRESEYLKRLQDKAATLKTLTKKEQEDKARFEKYRDNPQLPQTAITQLDDIVVELLYGMRKEAHSKQMAHGTAVEPASIDMINLNLKTNFKKYTGKTLRSKKYRVSGIPDVWAKGKCVLEIKNPYDPFSFNKKRFVLVKDQATGAWKVDMDKALEEAYYWQCQAYMWLTGERVVYLLYTLQEHYYMEGNEYDDLTFLDRVIAKKVEYSEEAEAQWLERLPHVVQYINAAKDNIMDNIDETLATLVELKELVV